MDAEQLAQQPLTASPAAAKKLDKLNLRTRFDLVLHLPLRYEDETHLYPIKDAPLGLPVLVEGEVTANEVQFKPRKQMVVRISDGDGSLVLLATERNLLTLNRASAEEIQDHRCAILNANH